MSDQPRQRNPWRLSLIIFLGVIGFYSFLSRPAEPVNDMVVNGELAYLALGRVGLMIVDLSLVEKPDNIGTFDTTGSAIGVAVESQYAYIADGRAGLRVLDVSNPYTPKEIGAYDTNGYSADVDIKNEYAYVADGKPGLLIINIGDKANPFQVSAFQVNGNVQRVVVQGKYAYLGDNQNQFRVVNISKPRQPAEVSLIDIGAEIQDMDISENRVYLATGDQGMVIVDITNPEQPQLLKTIDTPGRVQDVAVNGDIVAFLADGDNGVLVYDITNLDAIELVGSFDDFLDANQVEINMGGVYVSDKDSALHIVDAEVSLSSQRVSSTEKQEGRAQSVAVNEKFAFLAYLDQGLRVIDVTKPNSPVELATYDSSGEAIGVDLSGDFIYLADGTAGLRVLFLESTDSGSPRLSETALIDTPGEATQVSVVGQTVYLADGSAGLRIISMVNPAQPENLGWEDTPGNTYGVAVLGDYAYIADGSGGLRVVNILDNNKPAEVGSIEIPGNARAVVVKRFTDSGDRTLAYVAAEEGGLRIIDVSDPINPVEVSSFTMYETVMDLDLSGDNVMLATGSWGLRVVSVADPLNIAEVGLYNTPGEALGLDLFGQYTYVADNSRGMRIVDVANPAEPQEIGFYDVPRMVRGVTVAENYAYLTDVESGFRITEVSDPRRPKQVGHYDQGGIIEDMTVQGGVAYLADSIGLQTVNVEDVQNPFGLGELGTPSRANAVFVEKDFAYVMDNVFGLHIADVSDPTAIQSLSSHQTTGTGQDIFVAGNYAYIADGEAGLMIVNVADPLDPKTASVIDQFQNANSVIVLGDFAYLADGSNGLWIIDVSKPVAPETIAFVDTPGTALDIESSGIYLFIADGEAGVQVVYILNPNNPALVGGVELEGYSLDLDVDWRQGEEGIPGSFFVYVAKGDRGLEILGADKNIAAGITGLYETPGMAPLRQVVEDGFPIVSSPGKDKSARTVRQILFDVFVIGILGLLIWLGFFAQFLLPLKSLKERRTAFNRLLRYLIRMHGPAIRIENGKVVQSHGEGGRIDPGVILLDTASAAMLRTKSAFNRAIGPGVVFTDGEEFLHQETIDLHTLVRPLPPLGPLPSDDPFSPWKKRKEDEKEHQARQNRRKETSGFTRDGVEIVTNILAVVKLKSLPGQGGTRYGFNSQSVRMAITREGVVPNGLRNIPWNEVPAYLAVDVWREYLAKFTLIELFTSQNERSILKLRSGQDEEQHSSKMDETRFELILRMVHLRLTQAEVPILNEYGQEVEGSLESREFRILEEMGIEVKDVSISGIRFPRTVESQLLQQWLSTWLERARAERDAVENKHILAGEKGKEKALIDFADRVSKILGESLVDDDGRTLPFDSKLRPNLSASLEMLVAGTQQLIARNTLLQQWLLNENAELSRLLEWIRR
jgi:regulator of protease activity HflC (stomatin/prohibitin superfamily)